MLISVQSTDPKAYNTVRVNFEIPWKCEYVKYYVSSINTRYNIYMTTDEDKFEFYSYTDGRLYYTSFTNFINYTTDSLVRILNQAMGNKISWEYDVIKRAFKITALEQLEIEEPTHRVKLILGLYNAKFPIMLRANYSYTCPDIPILNHTKFFLVSLQGNPMYSNIGEQQHTPSVIGTIDTITRDNLPLIYNFEKEGKPLKIKTYTESLKNLEISLVDFQFQPIVLLNPLNISVKIKPAKNADVKDILSK